MYICIYTIGVQYIHIRTYERQGVFMYIYIHIYKNIYMYMFICRRNYYTYCRLFETNQPPVDGQKVFFEIRVGPPDQPFWNKSAQIVDIPSSLKTLPLSKND